MFLTKFIVDIMFLLFQCINVLYFFMDRIFIDLFQVSENKNSQYPTPTTNSYYIDSCYYKVCKDYIEFDTEQAENTKALKDKKTSFPKESLENADLYKPVLNKIMTTHEQYVKYNFVVPWRKNRLSTFDLRQGEGQFLSYKEKNA